jgi:hypothetical protein
VASGTTWFAVILIIGLIGLGIAQNLHLPQSSLAGAVPAEKTQQDINTCMKTCMNGCVDKEGAEQPCLDRCNKQCGVAP